MPFQSEKQRRYLWANEPEIARDWTDTYGSGIAKALGGRIPFANGTILPQRRPIEGLYYDEDLTNFGVSGADLTGRDVTSDDIFQDVYTQAFDASRPYGKKMDASMRGLDFMMPSKRMRLDLGDTLGGGIHRIPLDTPQGYQSNIRHGTGTALVRDAVAKYLDPDSTSMTPWGEDKKMRDPNLFARIAGNVIGQGAGFANEGFGMNFFQNPKQTYEDLLANWSAKETDYFTSPEQKAKTLANYFSTSEGYIPNKLAEMADENWKSFNREDLVKNTIQPDGSVMTLGPNFNYGETQAAPTNIKAPFMNPNVSDPSVMQPHDWKFGNQWQTAEKDEDEGSKLWEFVKKVGRFINPISGDMNPLGFLPRGGIANFANTMRGGLTQRGYEQAREQRRQRSRVANLLARKAADKSYSQKNLNQLTMGSRPGHYDRPGGGNGVQGTDTPASGAGGWGPGAR